MSSRPADVNTPSNTGLTTFIDDVLAGRAQLEDIDDYVDDWHETTDEEPGADLELHEYLGLSWDEYRRWGSHPESLRFVVAARRAQLPLDSLLEQAAVVGAAARSNDSSDAERVLNWLMERGRIGTEIRNI